MRYIIVTGGKISNVAVSDEALAENWFASETGSIGDLYDTATGVITPFVPVPSVVTMAQARKALIMSGITIASVDAAIDAIADATEREIAQTDWQYRDTVRRDSDLVTTLGTELGVTEQQQDALFILAAGLDG